MKIIHCADLHLSTEEEQYSLDVLREIVDVALREKASYLLFAGDTFNKFSDIPKMCRAFTDSVSKISKNCEIFLLAGNHEDLDRKNKKISEYDLGIPSDNIIDCDSSPFRLIEREGIEILAIPHQKDYKGYTDWTVPVKKSKLRIALAHASNVDLSFAGLFDEDDKAGVMDSELFQRFDVDYAALGHIHKAGDKKTGKVHMAYPGSARVWRKDEDGPRCVNILDCADAISMKRCEILKSGQFRKYKIKPGLDGTPSQDIAEFSENWGVNDWVWIDFEGLVENKSALDDLIIKYKTDYSKKVRRFDINTDAVDSCAGISSQEIAKKFLMIWNERKPADLGDEIEVWERAREIGLRRIKEVMEARS